MKYSKAALFAFAVFGSLQPLRAAAPGNDAFSNATLVSGSSLAVSGNNLGATMGDVSEPFARGNSMNRKSVWWKWTAPASGNLTVKLQGTQFSLQMMGVYVGTTAANLKTVQFDLKNGDIDLAAHVVQGVAYYLCVGTWDTQSGGDIQMNLNFVEDLSGVVSPLSGNSDTSVGSFSLNDKFSNAIELSGTATTAIGYNMDATLDDVGEPFARGNSLNRKSVWWKWTAPSSGTLTIYLQGTQFSLQMMGVYVGTTAANLKTVQYQATNGNITLTARVVQGVTYYLCAGTWDSAARGAIKMTLNLDKKFPGAVSPLSGSSDTSASSFSLNDRFSNAIELYGTKITAIGYNADATTDDVGEPFARGSSVNRYSVWWKWTAPANGVLSLNLQDTQYSLQTLGLYTGSVPSALKEVKAHVTSGVAAISSPVVAGITYYICVGSWSSTPGASVVLNLSTSGMPAMAPYQGMSGAFGGSWTSANINGHIEIQLDKSGRFTGRVQVGDNFQAISGMISNNSIFASALALVPQQPTLRLWHNGWGSSLCGSISYPGQSAVAFGCVPTPVILTPVAGLRSVSSIITFTGKVPYSGGIPVVEVSANGGSSWTTAAVSGALPPYSWSSPVTLLPGKRSVLVRAIDKQGNPGSLASREVISLQASNVPMDIHPQGSGTFTAGLAGKNLNLNMPYTVTATPGKGQIFKEWLKNGASFSRNATLTFTMEEGLTLTPVFIANPFPAVVGTFNGLVGNGTETNMGAFFLGNGFVTLTPTGTGIFTGSLRMEGQTTTLSGKFDGFGETTLTIKRTGKNAVTVGLKLDLASPGKVTGTVTGGTALAFTALPGVFTGVKPSVHPLNLARYTIALPAPDAALGHGYATMVVDAKGLATFAGKLADGTKFTTSARTVDDGIGNWVVPVHIPLYTGFAGMLLGEVVVPKTEPAAAADVTGSLGWLRPANTKATMFQAGFLKTLTPQGERYRLTTGLSLLTGNATTGNFTLTIGPGLAALTQNGTWPKTNAPALTKPPTGLTFTFTPTTGVFKGAFLRPVSGKAVSTAYEGVVFGTSVELTPGTPLRGVGFFTTGNASAAVDLTMPPP